MLNFNVNKTLAVAATFMSFQSYGMNMNNGQSNNDSFDSLTIQGEFSPESQKDIFQSVKNGIDEVNKNKTQLGISTLKNQTDINFFYTNPEQRPYHLTACIIEPKKGEKLTSDFHGSLLIGAAQDALQYEYKGNIFSFCMFAHGYDANGNEINKKYYDPSQVQNGNPNHGLLGLEKDFPNGIWKVEFVHRFGTGQKGITGGLKIDIDNKLVEKINKLSKDNPDLFTNPYAGKYDEFCGHITAANMNKQRGKIDIKSNHFKNVSYEEQVGRCYNIILDLSEKISSSEDAVGLLDKTMQNLDPNKGTFLDLEKSMENLTNELSNVLGGEQLVSIGNPLEIYKSLKNEYETISDVYSILHKNWKQDNGKVNTSNTIPLTFSLSGRQIINNKAVDTKIVNIEPKKEDRIPRMKPQAYQKLKKDAAATGMLPYDFYNMLKENYAGDLL